MGEVLQWKPEADASGREAELSALLREHDEAKSSARPRFVFVRGPQGVGKSFLFSLLRRALVERGTAVFEGGSAREVKRTFGLIAPIARALTPYLEQTGVPQPKLSELTARTAGLHGDSGKLEGRLELFDAVSELLSLAGRECPAFLFPDVELADKSSLELLRYLLAVAATPASKSGGLFILSFRDEHVPKALEEIAARVSARSISLNGLDLDGIKSFLSQKLIAQRLLDATGGHPQALAQLLERPVEPVDLFARRSQSFAAADRAILELLAVAKDALGVSVIAQALNRTPEETATQLDALVKAHLVAVRVVELTPRYRFAREPDRESFHDAMSFTVKMDRTAAVGRALFQAGEQDRAARLLLIAEPKEGAKAAVIAGKALASRGAHEEAAELFASALGHLAADKELAWQALAESQWTLGNYQGAAKAYVKSAQAPDAQLRQQGSLKAARALVKLGRFGLARWALSAAEGVEAELAQAEIHLVRGQSAKVCELARKILARESEPLEVRLQARNLMGKALLLQNACSDAEALFEANVRDAEGANLKQEAALARLNQGVAAHKQGATERAMACYQGTLPVHGPAQAQALANLGSLYADSGELEPALDHLTRALQAFSRFAGRREVAQVASNLARLHHFLGDGERATELSEHALKLAQELHEPYLEGSALLNLGAVQLDKRESISAARTLDLARAKFEQVGNDGYAALSAALKARAHLNLGERAQAGAELDRRCITAGAGFTPAAVEAELARGELFLGLNDLLGATRAAARAKDALLNQPDLEGPFRVYHLMGRLKALGGDQAGAAGDFTRAARSLDELTQRVAPPRRQAFLSVPRRSEVLGSVETELRLPRAISAPKQAERAFGLVGKSAPLQHIVKQLEPIGRSNTTVLVRGESGTGKELLAEAIHQLSPRRAMPLVKVNCAAMVEDLLLSELFGHEKGAFTGAVRERKGRFELADGGTLFLDEIGDITPKCQVALLRVLQEREFERVGGTKTLKVDVRVICATNRDLESAIAQGRFRADLYYRLKGVMLELPALRERLDDLPTLCSHFLERSAKERNEPAKRLAPEALKLLEKHTWPGNVRELENVLSAAVIFAEGSVVGPEAFMHVNELRALSIGEPVVSPRATPTAIVAPVAFNAGEGRPSPAIPSGSSASPNGEVPPTPPAAPAPKGPIDFYELARQHGVGLRDFKHQIEVQCIRRALIDAGGNISEAARLLQMKRSRLSQIVNSEASLREVAHAE
ncbi:MAG: sigma 54-interacting transcriptional regulator [Myxococcaceae bacterium]